MKKKIIALIAAAAVGICGCTAQDDESDSANIIDIGELEIGSSEGVIYYGTESSSSSSSSETSAESSSSSAESSSASSASSASSVGSSSSSTTFYSPSSSGIAKYSDTASFVYYSSSAAVAASSSSSAAVSSSASTTAVSSSSSASASSGFAVNRYHALNYNEVKGMWISYIDLAALPSSTENEFRNSISEVYDNCVSLGINTVYVHVRSHGDAYYSSDYFPRTKYLGGFYDPLSVMIEEAHSRGLSFQAWINPLRGCAVSDIERESGYELYEWAGGEKQLVTVGSYYYLNPAYDDVIRLVADSAREIAANYNVDGIHIDDYFYPTTEAYFDSEAFSQSGMSSLAEFRLDNCSRLVSALYEAVKQGNSSAIFGISCQGSIYNNYNVVYADVEKWCTESGYTDYIMPQIYYGFSNSSEPFEECANAWNNLAYSGNIPLIVGITAAKIGYEDAWAGAGKTEWITDEDILMRQFLTSRELSAYGGIGVYGYGAVFNADYSVEEQVNDEMEALKAAMN